MHSDRLAVLQIGLLADFDIGSLCDGCQVDHGGDSSKGLHVDVRILRSQYVKMVEVRTRLVN